MLRLSNTKSVVSIMGTAVTNGATVTANIDRLTFDYVTIDCIMGTSSVVSNKPSTLKLSESDITDSTGFADVTAFVGGGTGGFTIPNANTTTENIYRFNVDCRGRKRYLKLTATPLTTQAVVMAARLARGDESCDSTTTAGTTTFVSG